MNDITARPKILTQGATERANLRRFAFSPVTISATSVSAANEIVTNLDQEIYSISGLTISNPGPSAEINICIVDDLVAAIDANIAIKGLTIPSNGIFRLDEALMLNPQKTLAAYSSVANDLRVSGWITAYL